MLRPKKTRWQSRGRLSGIVLVCGLVALTQAVPSLHLTPGAAAHSADAPLCVNVQVQLPDTGSQITTRRLPLCFGYSSQRNPALRVTRDASTLLANLVSPASLLLLRGTHRAEHTAQAPQAGATSTVSPLSPPLLTGTETPTPAPATATTTATATSTPTGSPSLTNTPVPSPTVSPQTCPNTVLSQTVRNVEPGVFLVQAKGKGSGTGFVIAVNSSGTYVLTTQHAVQGNAANQIALLSPTNHRTYQAQVIQATKAQAGSGSDLVVVRIQPTNLRALPWANVAQAAAGQTVLSLGYVPGEGGPPSVNQGIISALHRDLRDGSGPIWIQHQTTLDPASAGGPLLTLCGSVLGVNSKGKYLTVGTAPAAQLQGVFYAFPADKARAIANTLIAAIVTRHVPQLVSAPPTVTDTPVASATASSSTQSRSFTGDGFTLTVAGGWTVQKQTDGTPIFSSADQQALVNVAETPVSGAPTADQIKKVIGDFATTLSKQLKTTVTVSYHPVSIGALTGLTGVLTFGNGVVTIDNSILSDGSHLVVTEEIFGKGTPQADIDQANAIVSSIQPTGTSATAVATATSVPLGPGSTYTGSGYSVTLPSGWTVSKAPDGTPAFESADRAVAVGVQEVDRSGAPTTDQIKQAISSFAGSLGTQLKTTFSISYQPIAVGSLTGLTGVLTAADGSVTALFSVLSDGQHTVAVEEVHSQQGTPQADLDQANQLINSTHVGSTGLL